MSDSHFYPPSPELDQKEFTKLSTKYKWQVVLACLGVVLFFILYLALVSFFLYLFTLSIRFLQVRPSLLSIASVLGALMLLLFTIKFVFKLKRNSKEHRIKLNPTDHPELMQFIQQICKEVGTNEPNSIYLVPDVNAYVSYSNLFMSLLGSQKKDLTIGLGLVGALNLSEYKAVIAHEFGHFSQRSMRVGIYIMAVNTVIHDMIFDRDKWDTLLAEATGIGFGIGLVAFLIGLLVSLIRLILNGFYQLLNRAYLALSREMEFNADKFAVSVTGSEAISSSLWKLDHYFGEWNSTLEHLFLANNNNISVENVFPAIERAFKRKGNEISELYSSLEKDASGNTIYFTSHEHSKVSMYSTHPPNYLRESNAKNPFIKGTVDSRSPWELFKKHEEIQVQATENIYSSLFEVEAGKKVSFEEFLVFIKEEEQENEVLSTYGKGLELHLMEVPTEVRLENISRESILPEVNLKSLIEELERLTEPFQEITESVKEMTEIAEGSSTKKEVQIEDKKYSHKQLNDAEEHLDKLWKDHHSAFLKPWDEKYFQYFTKLARVQNKAHLIAPWYQQHRKISAVNEGIGSAHEFLVKTIMYLEEQAEVSEAMLRIKSSDVALNTRKVNDIIGHFNADNFLPLPNIPSLELLKTSMLPKGILNCSSKVLEDGEQINQLVIDLAQARMLTSRVVKKNLCKILQFHAELENAKH
ncbi:MAG: M48 family metallopeptidase [Flavobacteriales bacterium]